MSNSISDIENSSACWFWLQLRRLPSHRRPPGNQGRDNGAKIIVCDPRRIETARIADRHLQLNNGSNMALVNAFGYVLLEEEPTTKPMSNAIPKGLDAYREAVKVTPGSGEEGLSGSARGNPGGDAHLRRRPIRHHYVGMGHPVWPCGGRGARHGKPGAAHRQLGRPNVGVGPVRGQTTYRAPAIWACCRTCFPAIRRSPTPPCGRNSPPHGASTRR